MPASTTPTPPTPPALSKGQIFFRRLGSTVFLWTIVLTAMFSTNVLVANWVFLGLMVLLAVTGLLEFYGMVEKRGLVCFRWFGVVTGIVMMAATHFYLTNASGHQLRAGKPAHVLMSMALYQRLSGSQQKIADLLAMPGTEDLEIEILRWDEPARPADLS